MILSDAINLRINELLEQHNLTAYKLSYRAGISNSIISDCKRGKVKEPTISSIIHICEGFNIELKDFFDSKYFKDVEAIDRFEKKEPKVV
ncbi:MAG: helix-turn-helix transcriptional regulator [Clostridia bacterium]|nr:helix-turn-helix transcriptional regulator [Clostridia bacterium]